ncbi:hypothetical protein Pse7367_1894 [Thalassoporum mexicanum PCC 7367]|uniref:AtaL-like protein n=1 Tax=Thalassoporum mexicanum TaxID=3457544 RepID=UPI00029FFAE8|nr:AtaL-like protein [Pseudanabaena sp. PCC 7367]AFY70170.1 hypothetical protein Pse7367_1894 [Pseudanabaena sp. PCC 7367]
MPHAIYSAQVNAPLETLWSVMVDKAKNPGKYNTSVQDYQVLEEYADGLLRQMRNKGKLIKERLTIDPVKYEIMHALVDHPIFVGRAFNAILQPTEVNPSDPLILTYALDWQPHNDSAEAMEVEAAMQKELNGVIKTAVFNTKNAAEQQAEPSQ